MYKKSDVNIIVKIGVILTYVIMLGVNIAATALPLNNQTTADVSNAYPDLFAPAGFTFSIWGLIYLLLILFVLYFIGIISRDKSKIHIENYNRIGVLFIILALANSLWLFAWHYEKFIFSLVLMLVMLLTLIIINRMSLDQRLSNKEKTLVKLPFSIYLGWITVATIANITVYLVSINWNGFNLSESLWTVIIIIVGLIISMTYTILNKDLAYGLVIIWAYIGIFIKHISSTGFNSQYPQIMAATLVSILALVISQGYIILSNRQRNK